MATDIAVDFKLERLYAGFVNSFGSLNIQAGNWADGLSDPAQSTHAIIDWFRRTGVAYGYYPTCERRRRDLEWFDVEDLRPVLHLESENFGGKVDHTLDKLIGSDARTRVGLLWTGRSPSVLEATFDQARAATANQDWALLLIVRQATREPGLERHRHGDVYRYPLDGHLFADGAHTPLAPAYLEWPANYGPIVARWERPNAG